MAVLHRAELRPTKVELLRAWLPGRPWAGDRAAVVERVAAFRFDDPAGAVGVETLLVRAPGGDVLQVPLTYRGAPARALERHLVGTLEHSVLGRRWVYDACADPVYVATLVAVALGAAGQAEELVEVDGALRARTPDATVRGTGTGRAVPAFDDVTSEDGDAATVVRSTGPDVVVRRVLTGDPAQQGEALVGTWSGQDAEVVLAEVRTGS